MRFKYVAKVASASSRPAFFAAVAISAAARAVSLSGMRPASASAASLIAVAWGAVSPKEVGAAVITPAMKTSLADNVSSPRL